MHARGVPKWTKIRRMKMMLNISFMKIIARIMMMINIIFVKIIVRSMMVIIETRSLKVFHTFSIIKDIGMAI